MTMAQHLAHDSKYHPFFIYTPFLLPGTCTTLGRYN